MKLMDYQKSIMERHMTSWINKIQESEAKSIELDAFEAYSEIIFDNMSQIIFGENILDKKIELEIN